MLEFEVSIAVEILTMQNYQTVVIGGGAAGISAAISKARPVSPLLSVKDSKWAKKSWPPVTADATCSTISQRGLLQRCCRPLVRSIFSQFGKSEITRFFQ